MQKAAKSLSWDPILPSAVRIQHWRMEQFEQFKSNFKNLFSLLNLIELWENMHRLGEYFRLFICQDKPEFVLNGHASSYQ